MIPKWLDDFVVKYAKKEKKIEKKAELNSEDYLIQYIYKTEEILQEKQFNKVAGLLAKDNDYSDQKIKSVIVAVKEEERIKKANEMYKKSNIFSRAGINDPYDKGKDISIKGVLTKGIFKNIFASEKKIETTPTDFDSIIKYCEKKSNYKLSSDEWTYLLKHAKKNKFDELTKNKLINACQRFIDIQKIASKGKLINKSNRIQTVREQVQAGLEVFKNLTAPSAKEEAENVRYITDSYPKDKDARDEDIKRQVEQENDTNKQIKKEKSVDRTMGLKRAGKINLENYAIYDFEGNFKGYYINDEELDEYAKRTKTADEEGKHTEETQNLFENEIDGELQFINKPEAKMGEYRIIPSNKKHASLDKESLWKDKLQNVYNDFEDWKNYSEMYGLAERLGYENETTWEYEGEYIGYDNKSYDAIYTAIQDENGNVYHGKGEYFDPEKDKWIPIEGESSQINQEMKRYIEEGMAKEACLNKQAKESEEEYKTELTPSSWEMKRAPSGYGKEKRPDVSAEGKKLVERYSNQIDELVDKMKPVAKKISNLKDKIKGVKESEEVPIQNEINAVAKKLEKVMVRMSDTDTILVEHKGKLLALISKYETSKIGFMDFLRDKFQEQGIESTLDRWIDEWNKIEPTIGNIEKRIIKRFTKISDIFDMEDNVTINDADLSELDNLLDDIIALCELMEEETSEFEYDIEEELQEVDEEEEYEPEEEIEYEEEYELEELPIAAKIGDDFIHIASKKEYLIDKISSKEITLRNILGENKKVDVETFKKEYANGNGQTKIAVNGRPNDIDKCRDCAFYNSGIGTGYYKCAECIHAYSEQEINEMKDDVNELSDYFTDRGISKSVPDNASNFSKKHASLNKKAEVQIKYLTSDGQEAIVNQIPNIETAKQYINKDFQRENLPYEKAEIYENGQLIDTIEKGSLQYTMENIEQKLASRKDLSLNDIEASKEEDPKAKTRNRGDCVFPSDHPKVKDDKDHFPINSEAQARNAIARANQDASHDWFKGTKQELVDAVTRAVKKKYPKIEISEEGKKASMNIKAQPAVETPTRPTEAPPQTTPTPHRPTPDSPPEDDPFNPPKPAVMPKPKACKYYMNKQAAYEDEANEMIKSFWNQIPEDHPFAQHPIISKHGKQLSEDSFKFTSNKYTGDPSQTQQTLQRIQELESEHQEELIQLAKEVTAKIFNIDESKLNANLGHPGEERAQQAQETPEEEAVEEEGQKEISPELREQINKRITMNALTHGSATHAMMTAHYLVDEGLRRISPELLNLYTQFASGSHKIYWLIDFTEMYADPKMQGRIGDTEVEYNEETGQPEVKATAIMFPILVHELIKGVMELMSLHGLKDLDEQQLKTIYDVADPLKDEQWLIQIGPELWRKFLKVVPEDIPLANIIAELSKQPPDIVNDIISKVIEDPENARQTFYEILGQGTGMDESAKSKVLFTKKALQNETIYKSKNKDNNGYSLAQVLYHPLDNSFKVYALSERLKRTKNGEFEPCFIYAYKSSYKNEDDAILKADNQKNITFEKKAFPPKTDEERLQRHQQKFPEDKVETKEDLPPRGTGRKQLSEIDVEPTKEELERAKEIEYEHEGTYNKIKKDIAEDDKLDMTMDDMAKSIRDEHYDEYDDYYDEDIGLPAMERRLKSAKKKPESAPSAKPPKEFWNKKVKEVKKGNPDYTEEQINKTVGAIWRDLSDSKKKEIREREGKKYKPADKKSSVDNVIIREADGEEITTYYHVKSPSGETIKVTPGQLAMNEGYVTDSKGNKFKAENFKAESLEDKVAMRRSETPYGDFEPEDREKYKDYMNKLNYNFSTKNDSALVSIFDEFEPFRQQLIDDYNFHVESDPNFSQWKQIREYVRKLG
ncbi:MAG: hypothetical protein ACFFG0_05280 [Candidatus Thorarchaeota archaeon]